MYNPDYSRTQQFGKNSGYNEAMTEVKLWIFYSSEKCFCMIESNQPVVLC